MRTLVLGLIVLFVAVDGSAHDFWLSANPPRPTAGARVTVTASVGEHYPKGTNFTPPERVDQWRVTGEGGDVPITREFRREGESLAADLALPSAGAYLGVMTIGARMIEMKGSEFTDYLKEEGLDQIIAARQASGDADKSARERYARYAKIAVRNGPGNGAHLTRAAGLKAELVPASDPTAVKAGQSLTMQLLAEGKPVTNAEVTAASAEDHAVKGRTDGSGRVTLTIDRDGAWLIKTVHMAKSTQPDADWESFWVTLVFHTAAP